MKTLNHTHLTSEELKYRRKSRALKKAIAKAAGLESVHLVEAFMYPPSEKNAEKIRNMKIQLKNIRKD